MIPDRLLDALLRAEVEFVIVGGVAAVMYGSLFVTRDLDICVATTSENFLRIQSALSGLHPTVRAGADRVPLDLDADRASSLKNLYISTDEGNLDCLGRIEGVGDFEAVIRESVEIRVGGLVCRVIGLDALIRGKEAMGRPRDLRTAEELKAAKERFRDSKPGLPE